MNSTVVAILVTRVVAEHLANHTRAAELTNSSKFPPRNYSGWCPHSDTTYGLLLVVQQVLVVSEWDSRPVGAVIRGKVQ